MDSYATYLPVLISILPKLNKSKTILELGTGLYSTPILSEFARINKINIIGYESNKSYASYSKRFCNPYYSVTTDINELDCLDNLSLVFVDNDPCESRGSLIKQFKNKSDYIIAHDTEQLELYNYTKILTEFRYSYQYRTLTPFTTILSDYYEVVF